MSSTRDVSSATYNLTLVLQYANKSTRNYVIEDVPASATGYIKDKILAVNANENNAYAAFYATFVENDGSAVSSINSSKLVNVEEEVIYNG